VTHLVHLAEDKKYPSVIAIRRLVNFIRVFVMLLEMYPEVAIEVEVRI
jgi:hypothetical protein